MPRPGSITEFIRDRGLLPPDEIDRIIATAPLALLDFQAVQAAIPPEQCAPMGRWLADFQRAADALVRRQLLICFKMFSSERRGPLVSGADGTGRGFPGAVGQPCRCLPVSPLS